MKCEARYIRRNLNRCQEHTKLEVDLSRKDARTDMIRVAINLNGHATIGRSSFIKFNTAPSGLTVVYIKQYMDNNNEMV